MTDVILSDEAKKEISEVDVILQDANILTVENTETYSAAGEFLKRIKGKMKALNDQRLELTRPIDATKKAIKKLFDKPLLVLEEIESKIKSSLIDYDKKQEEIRRAEEARLAALQKKEADRLARRAAKAAEKGQEEKAEQLQQEAQQAEAFKPMVPENTTKVAGIQKKKVWKFRILNARDIPRDYLIPNEKMLGDVARATKGTLNIPGIEFYSEDIISSGRM